MTLDSITHNIQAAMVNLYESELEAATLKSPTAQVLMLKHGMELAQRRLEMVYKTLSRKVEENGKEEKADGNGNG